MKIKFYINPIEQRIFKNLENRKIRVESKWIQIRVSGLIMNFFQMLLCNVRVCFQSLTENILRTIDVIDFLAIWSHLAAKYSKRSFGMEISDNSEPVRRHVTAACRILNRHCLRTKRFPPNEVKNYHIIGHI